MRRGLVLRLQPGQNQMFRDADVVAEGELLRDLRKVSAVPVPDVLVVEPDPEALDRPFFLMSRVAGHVPGGRPSIHRDAWLNSLSPGERRQVLVNGVEALAQVHATNWRRIRRFSGVAPGLAKELEQLQLWYEWASKGSKYALIEAGISHLHAHKPRAIDEAVLLWGDARPGNIIFADDLSVAAVLDWEMATVGPREADVGWWLMMDDYARRGAEGDVLDGFLSSAELVDCYGLTSGRRLDDLAFWTLLASIRLAITLLPAAASLMAREIIPRSSRFAHDNVPTQMIASQLGIEPPELSDDYRRLSRMNRMKRSPSS
jgi:aminoglycoside phosphotransferase (APT) family kinase protein